MSTSISTAFIKQFESEVHMAYQRMGSKLRNTVRQVNNVKGSQARFQKVDNPARSKDGGTSEGRFHQCEVGLARLFAELPFKPVCSRSALRVSFALRSAQ